MIEAGASGPPEALIDVMSWGVVVVFGLLGIAKLYLHAPLRSNMDVADRMGRYGEAAACLAISGGTMLLLLDIGPEWRLPAALACGAIALAGRLRDVERQWRASRKIR